MDIYYLDTSAIVKRYFTEPGSNIVDSVFDKAHRGSLVIAFSYWNIGEAAVVFDKYGRRLKIDSREIFRMMLRELRTLCRMRCAILVNVSPRIIRGAIELVFKYHIYLADALQIVSAKAVSASTFLTGDKNLAKIAGLEGLKTIYLS